ncbi:MAG: hypothetical protein Q4B54_08055 [Coriobacteriales bacterium]|nr:hypothetical protein [Coriobacteriales bacterium]
MAQEATPLTDEERAELEQLRAEKQARVERAELEALRAEQKSADAAPQTPTKAVEPQPNVRAQSPRATSQAAEEEANIRAARERGRKLMEPGDDLSMPLGQKIVLIGVAIAVVVVVAMFVFMPH